MKHDSHFSRGWSACLMLSLFLLNACSEKGKELPSYDLSELQKVVASNCLLIGMAEADNRLKLYFETDTVELPTDIIEQVTQDKQKWTSTLLFNDQRLVEIPTLGDTLTDVVKEVELNPTGYAPLVVQLQLSFPVSGRVRVIVEGKKGKQGDIEHLFQESGSSHQVEVYGLYAGYKNKLSIVLTDDQGRERARTTCEVETQSLSTVSLPKVACLKALPEQMEPGLTLVNYLGENEFDTHCPFMIDADGEIRWLLLLKGHPEIGNITAHVGFQRMKNGHFIFGDVKTSRLIEVDMVGIVHHIWDIHKLGYNFHHEVTEMPNGNLLVTVTKMNSTLSTGEVSIFDYVIEVNRETGTVVTEWDLKESLDETRYDVLNPHGEKSNWAHNNAVTYSKEDDAIIISMRYQGLAKLDRRNQVKWILSPHRGWKNKGLSGRLLNPLGADGTPITNKKVLDGETCDAGFEWTWGAHCPVIMPDGHLLIFDNGYYRQYEDLDKLSPKGYSRAVEYEIDEAKGTIRQLWQYGKERARSCFAIAASSVQYLPETDHVLFGAGLGCPTVYGIGAKIIEIDRATKKVVYETDLATPNFMVFHRVTRMPLYPEKKLNR